MSLVQLYMTIYIKEGNLASTMPYKMYGLHSSRAKPKYNISFIGYHDTKTTKISAINELLQKCIQ